MKTLLTKYKLKYLIDRLHLTKDIPGDIIEVGVYQGGTLYHLAQESKTWKKGLIGYDTFTGLPTPDPIDKHKEGEFVSAGKTSLYSQLHEHGLSAVLITGLFPNSALKTPVSFCHLDVDLYRSTLGSLKYLSKVLSPGGLIVVDDHKWTKCPGVEVAVQEFLSGDSSFEVHDEFNFQITLKKK